MDELKGLPWKALQLRPVIVFDSNASDNWDVQGAISGLAAKLEEITGQRAKHTLLPAGPDGHWGFDDFCVRMGSDAARAYLESADQAPEVAVSDFERLRLDLQRKVCVVRSLGRIAEQETGTLMTRGTFIDVNYAHYICQGDEDKQVSVPRVWMTDERRVEVEELRYVPGGEAIAPGEYLNLWRGMGVEPEPGDVSLWLELLERQVPDEGLRKWVIQWFAYPLQNLGAKLSSYLYLFGPSGTGKNALLAPVLHAYGSNGVVIGKDQIASQFNSVYATRQFVNIDELHGGNEAGALAVTNRVKLLTTSAKLVVNKKGDPEYEVDNHVNLALTANYNDRIPLDDTDPRAAVIKFGVRLGEEWWSRYFEWAGPYEMPRDDAAAAVYGYLLGVDLTGFNPAAHAPATEWKELVTDATRSPMDKWVRDLWDDPDSTLPPLMRGYKVLTPEQLGAAYYPDDPHKNTPGLRNQLGLRMHDMGFVKTEIKADGAKYRIWVVGDRDKAWTNADLRAALRLPKGKY